ncbi:MAG: hypothetical protein ABJH63_16665 [Rhizobiaceae bacterium]
MLNAVKLAVICGLLLCTLPASAEQTGLLELGTKSTKDTIVPIGSVPAKKIIPLELGSLRTEEAQLPPAPLTRSQRMALRAKRAVSRQRAVGEARRSRNTSRSHKPPQKVEYDMDEEIPMGSNGEPVLE